MPSRRRSANSTVQEMLGSRTAAGAQLVTCTAWLCSCWAKLRAPAVLRRAGHGPATRLWLMHMATWLRSAVTEEGISEGRRPGEWGSESTAVTPTPPRGHIDSTPLSRVTGACARADTHTQSMSLLPGDPAHTRARKERAPGPRHLEHIHTHAHAAPSQNEVTWHTCTRSAHLGRCHQEHVCTH